MVELLIICISTKYNSYVFWLPIELLESLRISTYIYQQNDNIILFNRAAFVMLLILSSLLLLVASAGIIASVYYKDCDPLVDGQISGADQVRWNELISLN